VGEIPDTLEKLLNALLDKALSVTNARIGSSFFVDPAARHLRLVASKGLKDLKKGATINIDESLIKYVIDEKKPLLEKTSHVTLEPGTKTIPNMAHPHSSAYPCTRARGKR
jgi:signal transduction protein with GAF and PtsI domain